MVGGAESLYVSNAAMSRPVVFTRSSPPSVLMWIIHLETIGCHCTFAGFIDIAVDFTSALPQVPLHVTPFIRATEKSASL